MGKIAEALAKIDPSILDKIEHVGIDVNSHEDSLTTLSTGDTWRDIHGLLKNGSADIEDPDILKDLSEVADESYFASKVFKDAYDSVSEVLETVGIPKGERDRMLHAAKLDLADTLNEIHNDTTAPVLGENPSAAQKHDAMLKDSLSNNVLNALRGLDREGKPGVSDELMKMLREQKVAGGSNLMQDKNAVSDGIVPANSMDSNHGGMEALNGGMGGNSMASHASSMYTADSMGSVESHASYGSAGSRGGEIGGPSLGTLEGMPNLDALNRLPKPGYAAESSAETLAKVQADIANAFHDNGGITDGGYGSGIAQKFL